MGRLVPNNINSFLEQLPAAVLPALHGCRTHTLFCQWDATAAQVRVALCAAACLQMRAEAEQQVLQQCSFAPKTGRGPQHRCAHQTLSSAVEVKPPYSMRRPAQII
jgi:hypothetical protein